MAGESVCQQEQIIAYIDGDLDDGSQAAFEKHLEDCDSCRSEVAAQRLLLCELDAAMAAVPQISAPRNFAHIIAAHAETDMRGVRSRAEHKRALRLVLIIALAAFSLLGVSANRLFIANSSTLARAVFAFAGFIWSAIYDAAASLAVISKVLSRRLVIESGSLRISVVLLGLAVLLLSRLITSYHRTQAIE